MILCKACSAVAVALVVLLAACQRMVEPTARIPVEFIFGVFHPAVEPVFVVQPQAERMRVRGSFRIPCHPYNATAAAEVSEGTLLLRVTGRATGACPQDVVSGVHTSQIFRLHPPHTLAFG